MSTIFKLDWRDLLKGLLVAILSAVMSAVLSIIQNGGTFTADSLPMIATVALSAGLGYLLKNLATDENGKVLGKF